MSGRDPTILDPTQVEDFETVPTLPQLAAAIPLQSTRALINVQLGRGATADGVTGAVSHWLTEAIDWRDAGVPSGRLGPAGIGLLQHAIRVLVDGVERSRRPPPRSKSATPRPTVPRPPPVVRMDDEPFEILGEPGDDDR